jgi:hypothetical protein
MDLIRTKKLQDSTFDICRTGRKPIGCLKWDLKLAKFVRFWVKIRPDRQTFIVLYYVSGWSIGSRRFKLTRSCYVGVANQANLDILNCHGTVNDKSKWIGSYCPNFSKQHIGKKPSCSCRNKMGCIDALASTLLANKSETLHDKQRTIEQKLCSPSRRRI